MFKRKKDEMQADSQQSASAKTDSASEAESTKVNDPKYTPPKGRPTPSRKEREAARKKPLVITDRKAAKAAERQALREQRMREQEAMRTGNEKYMPAKDRGPQRRYIRNYIDARFNVGDYMLLVLFLLVLVSWLVTPLQLQFTLLMWVLLLVYILDIWWVWRKLKKKLADKFGDIEPGSTMYAVNRAMMLRFLRLPKPQVKRGQYPS